MHQAETHESFSTEGYFFSPVPFNHTDKIEALQLAIVLGISDDIESEIILVARSSQDEGDDYQLAMVGRLQITDGTGAEVTTETLRQKPVEQLSEQHLKDQGCTIHAKPHFIWLKGSQALQQSKSYRIYSSAHNQLQTLRQLNP